MYEVSFATHRFIESFVNQVLLYSARPISDYEKSALAYAMFTVLRYCEAFFNSSHPITKDKDKSDFEFRMNGDEIRGEDYIKNFFDLALGVCEFLKIRDSIFDEDDNIYEDSTFSLFFDLILLFQKWEKDYARELTPPKADKANALDGDIPFNP